MNQSTTVVREPSRLIVGEETHQRGGAVRRTAVKTTNQSSCLHRRLRRGHLSPVNKTLRLRSTREMKRETSREMKTEDDIVGSGQRRRENASPAPERIESQSTSSPVPGSVRALGFFFKDFGLLSYFLGMEGQRNSQGLYLTQTRYIADLLHKTKMSDAKPMPTPICSSTTLTLQSGDPLPSGTEYRAVIGSLQYLSLTRPDIAYAVNKLSQFMHLSRTDQWAAAKRILRYLAGTPHKGIFFSSQNTPSLHAFTDADWAGNRSAPGMHRPKT